MKLTVVIADEGSAIHVGGPIAYRRVTVDLTPEQVTALRLRNRWETRGITFIEPEGCLSGKHHPLPCPVYQPNGPDEVHTREKCIPELP